MSSRLDLNRKDPWVDPPKPAGRIWVCPKCGVGLSEISVTRGNIHIRKCDK